MRRRRRGARKRKHGGDPVFEPGVVRGDDERGALPLRCIEQQLGDGGGSVVVEIGRRLVGEYERRPIHQRTGDGNALLLADG